ncbi:glutathione S-transferase family protein [Chelatococcus reniformis]|nr:glutathione S-transferase family protein [Chelatococcus reniformis]
MMILRASPPSPYSRLVRIAAEVLGLGDRITMVPPDLTDDSEVLWQQNPLGKIPTLITEDGTALFDSRVIVDYLDHLAGGSRIIPAGPERFQVLRRQALAIGLLDAALLQVYEGRYRPQERRHDGWLAMQAKKVTGALAELEAAPPALTSPPDVGQIAVACALGYLDLRFGGRWRAGHPALVDWLDRFAASVPAYGATHVNP